MPSFPNKSLLQALLIGCLFLLTAGFSNENPDTRYDQFYKKAERALDQNQFEQADFWMARYVGEIAQDPRGVKTIPEIYPLFRRHISSEPTSTLSTKYDREFLRWFPFASYSLWGVPDASIDEKTREFQLYSVEAGRYMAAVVAQPVCRGWMLQESDKLAQVLVIAAGGAPSAPALELAQIREGFDPYYFKNVTLPVEEKPLQYIWPLEFFDLDDDGTPELWVRYNYTWSAGFTQELAIYKITNEGLELFKKFTGNYEGIARRVDHAVEVAQGVADSPDGKTYDRHHFQKWVYQNGSFEKTEDREVPNVLMGPEWKKYYLNDN